MIFYCTHTQKKNLFRRLVRHAHFVELQCELSGGEGDLNDDGEVEESVNESVVELDKSPGEEAEEQWREDGNCVLNLESDLIVANDLTNVVPSVNIIIPSTCQMQQVDADEKRVEDECDEGESGGFGVD